MNSYCYKCRCIAPWHDCNGGDGTEKPLCFDPAPSYPDTPEEKKRYKKWLRSFPGPENVVGDE